MLTSRKTILIQWGDCDAMGIVYYPRYFEWFDACTHGLFEEAGLSIETLFTQYRIAGLPMVDTRARFIRSSTFGEEVVIESTITRWGHSSFDVRHRLSRGPDLFVEGFETRVWTVRNGQRLTSAPVPADVKARFGAT